MNARKREHGERGQPASFDPHSGAVHGSGSDSGGSGNGKEDYDTDSAAGSGAEPVGGPRPLRQTKDEAR